MADHKFTPEVLYADTKARQRAYAQLSRRFAAEGNAYGAVHAAWASDINTVQVVIWERVMVASPNPDEQFFTVATTVARALALYAAGNPQAGTAQEMLEQARAGLASAFDPVAQQLLTDSYLPLDHLAGLPAPSSGEGETLRGNRLSGEPVEAVVNRRQQTAQDCMEVAKAMNAEGRLSDAMQQAWQADWATLEAYLLTAANVAGDPALVSVDLRWALAVDAIGRIGSLPKDFHEAVSLIRETMTTALGSVEGTRLEEMFQPVA